MRSSIKVLAVAALTTGALVIAPAAFAADPTSTSVNQGVTGGVLSATMSGGTFDSIVTSHSAEDSVPSTAFSLAADDLTGTGDGWNVTQKISDLAYTGDNGGTDIPAANFSIVPGTITANGNADTTGVTAGAGGALGTDKPVLSATAGSGVGSYTQAIAATLEVPADSRAGTYSGTLTTTIAPPTV